MQFQSQRTNCVSHYDDVISCVFTLINVRRCVNKQRNGVPKHFVMGQVAKI